MARSNLVSAVVFGICGLLLVFVPGGIHISRPATAMIGVAYVVIAVFYLAKAALGSGK